MPDQSLDLSLMLLLGLASSLHCVTMCGPIIAVASAPLAAKAAGAADRRRQWSQLTLWQVAYHAGRGITYVAIGTVLALAGQMINALFPTHQVGGGIQIVIGLLLMVVAATLVIRGRAVSTPSPGSFFSRLVRRLVVTRGNLGAFLLGLVTGFLPCGVLYAAFARAVAADSALAGGLLLLAFWAGTAPLLFAVGLVSGQLFRLVGRYATALVTAVMILTGGWLVVKGYRNVTQIGTPPCHRSPSHSQIQPTSAPAKERPC